MSAVVENPAAVAAAAAAGGATASEEIKPYQIHVSVLSRTQ